VIARIDGKAFHTLTRGMKSPWDEAFQECMYTTALYLAKNIQGCKLAYTQSDEISLLLTDWEAERTQGWFQYKVEKVASVSASMASAKFLTMMLTMFPERKDLLMSGKGLPSFDARFFSSPNMKLITTLCGGKKMPLETQFR